MPGLAADSMEMMKVQNIYNDEKKIANNIKTNH